MILGASASGTDIAEELAKEGAKHVYLCAREHEFGREGRSSMPYSGQIVRAPTLQELRPDGSVVLADGTTIGAVDVLLFATGYTYDFPFLRDRVTVTDNRVLGLFQHVFPPALAPTLAFVGLPWKVRLRLPSVACFD
jgi:cation diffusion facilitator CzcD-associated flavoprotein CzcO